MPTESAGNQSATDLATLREINDEQAVTLIPAILFVALLMLVGIVGNVLVCFVFSFRLPMRTQHFLIICLAVFDLLSSAIAMPTEIVDMRNSFMFESGFACRLLRFINHFCVFSSVLILIFIAVDRYRKVCLPFQPQIRLFNVKLISVGCTLFSLLLALPSVFLYGIRTTDTPVPGIKGYDCSTSDEVVNTLFPVVFNGIIFLAFFAVFFSLLVLYVRIGMELKRHKKYMARHSVDAGTPKAGPSKRPLSGESQYAFYSGSENQDSIFSDGNLVPDNTSQRSESRFPNPILYDSQGGSELQRGRDSSSRLNNESPVTVCSVYLDKDGDVQDIDSIVDVTDPTTFTNQGKDFEEGVKPLAASDDSHSVYAGHNEHHIEAVHSNDRDVAGRASVYKTDTESETNFSELENRQSLKSVQNIKPNLSRASIKLQEQPKPSNNREQEFWETYKPDYNLVPKPTETQNGVIDQKLTELPKSIVDEQSGQLSSPHPDQSKSDHPKARSSSVKKVKSGKGTAIAMSVTVAFFLSFLPHLCLLTVRLVQEDFDRNLSAAGLVLYHIFLRSYFINSVTNPIIYGMMNPLFRAQCVRLAKQIRHCKRGTS